MFNARNHDSYASYTEIGNGEDLNPGCRQWPTIAIATMRSFSPDQRCRVPIIAYHLPPVSQSSHQLHQHTHTHTHKMPEPLRHKHLQILKHFIIHVEDVLEKNDQRNLAQWLRFKQYLWWETNPEDFWKWSQKLIETEIHLREIAQREILLQEELQKLATASSPNQSELYVYKSELTELHEQYWRVEREYNALEWRCPSEPAKRAYDSVHKNPHWHLLNSWLRKDCANRGGCCGRDCKCCERPPAPSRLKGWGHCTAQCKCCYRVRGFPMHTADRELYQPKFRVGASDSLKWDRYSLALHTAYIWGVASH